MLDEPVPGVVPRLVVGAVLVAAGTALVPIAGFAVRRIRGPIEARDGAVRGRELRGDAVRAVDAPPWGLGELAGGLLSAVLFAFLVSSALGRAHDVPLLVQLCGSIATLAGGTLVAAALARRSGASVLAAFAARVDGAPRAAAAGVAGYVLLVPGLIGVALAWPATLEALGQGRPEQAVVAAMRALPVGDRPVALLLGVVVGPLFEELFFRGFLQRTLARYVPASIAIVAASLAFASLHGLAAFLPVFALSLILGSVLHATQRIAASFAVHALFNAQTFLFLWGLPEVGRVLEGSPPGLWNG